MGKRRRRIKRGDIGDLPDSGRKRSGEEVARAGIEGAYAAIVRRQGPRVVVGSVFIRSIVGVIARERQGRGRVRAAERPGQENVEQMVAAQE